MKDEIIEELWSVKDQIAKEHDYDLDALVAHLRSRSSHDCPRAQDQSPKRGAEHIPSADMNEQRR